MNVAFYAPMKSPNHPTPSGDQAIARQLVKALEMAGFQVRLASSFRTWDKGNFFRQRRLAQIGEKQIERILKQFRKSNFRPDFWFTYHVYYKAPDYFGPVIAKKLNIPYIIAEASYSPKRKDTPWKFGLEKAHSAICSADLILNLNPKDEAALLPLVKHKNVIYKIKPFMDLSVYSGQGTKQELRRSFANELGLQTSKIWLVTAAMMRYGDKLSSYKLLAKAIELCINQDFYLLIAGDGPAREEIEKLFRIYNLSAKVHFLGLYNKNQLFRLFKAGDLFIWPAVNEAYGMAFLEAQYAGLPVLAGNYGGVSAVISNGVTGILLDLVTPARFAAELAKLVKNSKERSKMGIEASEKVRFEHNITNASIEIRNLLYSLIR